MKKAAAIAYCAVFFAAILAPLLLLPFSQNKPTENRPLAPLPAFVEEGAFNLEFPSRMEDFFQDHFFGRTAMIDGYDRLAASVFRQSANDKVIVGGEGYLFLAETAGDYDGGALFSDNEMRRLTAVLTTLSETLENRGKKLLIAIAPNKNTLYGQYMPDNYLRGGAPSNLERLLEADRLTFVDLAAALGGDGLYYKTDTHWNGKGARVAAQAITDAIASASGVSAGFDWEGVAPSNAVKTGDLAQMLYPNDTPAEPDFAYADAAPLYDTLGNYRSPDDLRITTRNGQGAPLSLYAFRDSFGVALIPYLSNAYRDAHYTRQMPLALENDEAYAADIFLLEMVERRLGELLTAAPTLLADETYPFPIPSDAESSVEAHRSRMFWSSSFRGPALGEARAWAQGTRDGLRVYGCAPGSHDMFAVSAMIEVDGEVRAYDVFPVWEASIAEENGITPPSPEEESGAFSFLIEELPAGTYPLYIRYGGVPEGYEAVCRAEIVVAP